MTDFVRDYTGVHACSGVLEYSLHEHHAYDSCAHDGHAVTDTFLVIVSDICTLFW